MNAPFRELFVELPRAVFEVLQGIGERAASDGLEKLHRDFCPPKFEPQPLTFLRDATARRLLAERYGWITIENPIPVDEVNAVDLVVRRACGHRSRVRLGGELFEQLKPRAALHEVDRILFRHHEHGRRCYCVQPRSAS